MKKHVPTAEIPQGVQDVANHYSKATGIPCMVLDIRHASLFGSPCEVCELLSSIDGQLQQTCFETHVHNALLADRFGGSYTYFCRFSLLYWVSPVYVNGSMEYAIIAGAVMVLEDSEALDDAYIKDDETYRRVKEALEKLPHLAISRVHSLSEVLRMCAGWASGYAEHRMVENRQSTLIQSRISQYIQEMKEEDDVERLHNRYPIEKEAQLQTAIRWGDRQTAQQVMNELLGMIFCEGGTSIDKIRFRVMELMALISRAAVQGGAPEDKVLEISYRCQREVIMYQSLEGLSLWLSKILHQFTDLVFASKDNEYTVTIAKAVSYIRQNYQKDITLESVAASVSLSANYFSKMFNQTMHLSFSSYVNQLRIEKAQQLLLTSGLPLVEISALVGFDDQSYFSKVFKKMTALTPGEFRKRGGRIPSDTFEIHETKD
jgi:AraC-like DNA-binding protein/ligand-binding sensor protein